MPLCRIHGHYVWRYIRLFTFIIFANILQTKEKNKLLLLKVRFYEIIILSSCDISNTTVWELELIRPIVNQTPKLTQFFICHLNLVSSVHHHWLCIAFCEQFTKHVTFFNPEKSVKPIQWFEIKCHFSTEKWW